MIASVFATLGSWLTDGLLLLLAGTALLLALLRRQLREEPRWLTWALVAVVAVGAGLRLTLPHEISLTAWPYSRTVPMARWLSDGPLLQALLGAAGAEVYLTDLVFRTNFMLAVLSPLCVFVHARYLLRDARAALVAAALLAVLPVHLRFSMSDVYFVQSIALSSFAFALTYAALLEKGRTLRHAATVALPIVALAAFQVRQLNLLFVPLLLWTALGLVGARAPRLRRVWVVGALTAAATVATIGLLDAQPTQMAAGLGLETLENAAIAFVHLRYNTLVHPWITPPVFALLAVAGVVVLWRAGGPWRPLFLLGWLGAFFVAHALVLPKEMTVQARYHLHLAVPFVLLAAPAALALVRWRRWMMWPLALYAAAVPAIHLDFVRDTGFDNQHEWSFALRLRDHVPRGCTVLEYTGPDAPGGSSSRAVRVGRTTGGDGVAHRWTVVPLGAARDAPSPLHPEAERLLAAPPACVFLLEGLPCWMRRHRADPEIPALAPACLAVTERAAWRLVDETSFPTRLYDDASDTGLPPGEPVTLRLYQLVR